MVDQRDGSKGPARTASAEPAARRHAAHAAQGSNAGCVLGMLVGLVLGVTLAVGGGYLAAYSIGLAAGTEEYSVLEEVGFISLWMLPGLATVGILTGRWLGLWSGLLVAAGLWMILFGILLQLSDGELDVSVGPWGLLLIVLGLGMFVAAAIITGERDLGAMEPSNRERLS